MMDSLRSALTQLQAWLDWLPNSVAAVFVLSAVAAVALSAHHRLLKLANRLIGHRLPYVKTLLARTHGLTRLALLLLALVVAVPVAPLDNDTAAVIARLLLIAIVILLGWAALTAVNLAADIYLMRFSLDTLDNLLARKHVTQVRVLLRAADTLVVLFTIGTALMTFESVRQYGVSVFASAGVAGLVVGLAARPVLSNLFAGIQLAMTQPIRIDDFVVIENERGNIEEITSTYVVVRLWDLRRMIVPLSYFIEKPFQNWTRDSSALIGAILLYVDYSAPVAAIRSKLEEVVAESKFWNRSLVKLQVHEAREQTLELRALVSANSAGALSDLRNEVREKLIDFLQREYPQALPRQRQESVAKSAAARRKPPRSGSARR